MFCPKCKCEYREGYTKCSDCNVDLVEKLKDSQDNPEYIEYEFLLSTYNPGTLAILKSLLLSENIEFYVENEHFSQLHAATPMRFFVNKDMLQKAKELVKEFL